MKSKFLILIGIILISITFLSFLYVPAYLECSEGLQWDLSCSLPNYPAPFEEFVKQKATMVMDMTLEKYRINSKQLTVQDGFTWDDDEFFMAESIADDGNRYYLMTVFAHDAQVDKIDVQIFKIISEKCTTEHVLNRQGCAPEYIQELKIPVPPQGIDYLLDQNDIDYLSDSLVVTGGWSFDDSDPGCGAVIDTDYQTHWFGIDSISEPKSMTLYSENPNPCKVNTSSCFCSAQMNLTILTLDELSYFTIQEEEKYATILLKYIQNNAGMKNIEPKFRIGKFNLNFTDSTAIGYCGERPGNNRSDFFSGAIVNGYVKDYGLDREPSLLCAIPDDAKWWERK